MAAHHHGVLHEEDDGEDGKHIDNLLAFLSSYNGLEHVVCMS